MQFRPVLLGVCVILLYVVFEANAQVELPKVIPPSPNVSALAKFIDVPVGLYTGTPQIDVPIYTVVEGSIKVPISLSYHAGGVKVSEMASQIGLSWALQAGGSITRTVVGLSDESQSGYLNSTVSIDPDYIRKSQYISNTLDGQPDMFYCTVGGRSFRFVFDEEGNIHTIPKQNVIVKKLSTKTMVYEHPNAGGGSLSGNEYYISGWEVVDESGTKYTFTATEQSSTSSINFNSTSLNYNHSINSWHLTEVSSVGGDLVTFTYEDEVYSYDLPISATLYILQPTEDSECDGNQSELQQGTSAIRQFVKTKRLSSIVFSNGKIKFCTYNNDNGRADLVGTKALEKIVVEDLSGHIIKQFVLTHEYLIGNSVVPYNTVQPASGEKNYYVNSYTSYPDSFKRRLMLKGVVEKDAYGTALNTGYEFEYIHDLGLPNRAYPIMDHWGYANSPETSSAKFEYTYNNGVYSWVGKSPNLQYAEQGALSKVSYPTGGNVQYEFELHDANVPPSLFPPVYKFKRGPSLSMTHAYYDRHEYDYEVKEWKGEIQRHYYVEFSVNSLSPVNTEIVLENVPYYHTGVLGFYLVNVNNPGSSVWSGYVNGTFPISLPNGTYRLYHYPSTELLNSPNNPSYGALYSARITGWYEQVQEENPNQYKVGGLRLKESRQYESNTSDPMIRKYTYTLDGSSGSLISFPRYVHQYSTAWNAQSNPTSPPIPVSCGYVVLSTETFTPLATTQGSYVGYSFVSEEQVDKHNNPVGKIEYTYSTDSDIFIHGKADEVLNIFPYLPSDNRDWLRGYQIQQSHYAFKDNTYRLIKNVLNHFDLKNVVPVSMGRKYGIRHLDKSVSLNTVIEGGVYTIYSGYVFNTKSEVMENDVTTTHEYIYSERSLLPIRVTNIQSNGGKEHSYISYPLEYANGIAFIDNLKTSNIVNVEIERANVLEDIQGNLSVIGGVLKKFDLNGRGNVTELYNLEISGPVDKSQFKFSSRDLGLLPPEGEPTQFLADARYKKKISYDLYDGNRLLQYTLNDNETTSFIWGYNKQFPVSKIQNASYSSIESVLGAGFTLESGGLSAAQQNLLRLSPQLQKSTISTYMYKPLVGMISATDPNANTIYYEYDSFGRIKLIKDNNNKILKIFSYHYKQ